MRDDDGGRTALPQALDQATAACGTGGLVPLPATANGYLAAGILACTLGERTVKHRAALGHFLSREGAPRPRLLPLPSTRSP